MDIELTKKEEFEHKKLLKQAKGSGDWHSISLKEKVFRSYPKSALKRWIEGLPEVEYNKIFYNRDFLARPKQLPPNNGKYRLWIVNAGRGFGKTWVGAQELIHKIRYEGVKRTSIAGRTLTEAINVMVLGESGILNQCPPDFQPEFKNDQLYWPNGAVTLIFSAEKPDSARGIQNEFIWFDEVAAYRYPDFIDQMMLGLRLGKAPGAIFTTTPRPVDWFKKFIKRAQKGEKGYYLTNGSTFENKGNLAKEFIVDVIASYPEGSLLAEQELYGKIVEENADALFKLSNIDKNRVPEDIDIEFNEIVVAIDPSVTASATSDLAGIVVVGRGVDNHYYVIEDASGVMKTEAWSRKAVELYHKYSADVIVAEVNNGGDLVEMAIRAYDPYVNYEKVTASRGKKIRAEPVSNLYFKDFVHHIGCLKELENEMCDFTGADGQKSPDRMDALVWGITHLFKKGRSSFMQFISNKLDGDKETIRKKLPSDEIKEANLPMKKSKWEALCEDD